MKTELPIGRGRNGRRAQRSAEAAKEIKSLITHNVEQVEHGTSLVDKASKTMGEIVSSIKRVSDIVAEISSATTEQRKGIQQVGDAVGQTDQVTQQNAALVEVSAAAAVSLKIQAQQLVQAMAFFKAAGEMHTSTTPSAVATKPTPNASQKLSSRSASIARNGSTHQVRTVRAKVSGASQGRAPTAPSVSASDDSKEWASF